MANQRILQGRAAVLSVQLLDYNGVVADAVGTVTVGVSRANGTSLVTPGTATTKPAGTTGVYNYTLAAANTALLDELTVTWSDSAGGSTTTTVDVVGGYYFSVQEARQSDSTLGDQAKYPDAFIVKKRQQVEEFFERVTGRAFVPRYRRETVTGSGLSSLLLAEVDVRSIRAATNYGTSLTVLELAALIVNSAGSVYWPYNSWYRDVGSVVIDYEYGWDSPPSDLKDAALVYLRHRLNTSQSGITDQATSFVQEGGGSFVISQPGVRGAYTGIPFVDEALEAHRRLDLVVA